MKEALDPKSSVDVVRQYDQYAESYERWTEMPLRKYAWRETVASNLPELAGKRVLDLACGTGTSAEILREKGAGEIIGVDSSQEQLEIFRQKFPESEAICADIQKFDFKQLGKFDTVTALFLFEYFKQQEDIGNVIQNVASAMKEGAEFYGVTIDPIPVASVEDYYGIHGEMPAGEGASYTDYLPDGATGSFPVQMYYWPESVIATAFRENGMQFTRLPVTVAKEGIEKYGADYWKEYLENPIYVVFKATKSDTVAA